VQLLHTVLEAGSAHIIGGADGSTAIYVTSTLAPWLCAAAACLVLLVGGICVGMYLYHKQQGK